MRRIEVIDSHTEGEPTRVILTGLPDLGPPPIAAQAARFAETGHDYWRGVLAEPRGSEVWVGALLLPPERPGSIAGIVFFNTVGPLGMCGHGLIGVVATLAHLNRLTFGWHQFDTPVGTVRAELLASGAVKIENVPSHRTQTRVTVDVPGIGPIVGDVAYGGNWFFLTEWPGAIHLSDARSLTDVATAIRNAIEQQGVTGDAGEPIDHIELCGSPHAPTHQGRSFILCPGLAFDRSPCGTGTSAKLACLAADGKLAPGDMYHNEGIAGGVFQGRYTLLDDGRIRPEITGRAWVTAEATLLFAADDPFQHGLP